MYCPQCGQLAPENMRFCSRCGLPLAEVSDWLIRGTSAALRDRPAPKPLSPKRKATRAGAKIMFWGGVLLPIFLIFSMIGDTPIPLFVPFIVFIAGLSIFLYSRLFGEETSPVSSQQPQDPRLVSGTQYGALPPRPDSDFVGTRREVRTAEIVGPPSVTERTTKLLDHDS